jgi:hypothetical protein
MTAEIREINFSLYEKVKLKNEENLKLGNVD